MWFTCSLLIVMVLTQAIQVNSTAYVQSSDPDDPVLQEALGAEGQGWRLTEMSTECKRSDVHLLTEWQNCSRVIEIYGGCVDAENELLVNNMLIFCRRECRDHYSGVKFEELPPDIISHGGFGDFLEQPFGFKLPVCSLQEGYTFRQLTKPIDFAKYLPEYLVNLIPALTESGFTKVKIPPRLYSKILQMRDKSLESGDIEYEIGDTGIQNGPVVIENASLQKSKYIVVNRTQMIQVSKEVRKDIFETLGPLAEDWAGGLKLKPTSIYGIRRYRNRSTLLTHTDKAETHVISVIMNIAQDVEEDWALNIKDHEGRDHTVFLQAGEMLWYESAKLLHGRQKPFKGSYFDNMFIHYMPRGLWYEEDQVMRGTAFKISEEAVRWSQRNMKPTNWSRAWESYDKFEASKEIRSIGLNNKQVILGSDSSDEDEEIINFTHLHPTTYIIK